MLAGGRVVAHLMFGVQTTDLATFAAVSITLVAVALGACYVPARRSARRDVLTVLRLD